MALWYHSMLAPEFPKQPSHVIPAKTSKHETEACWRELAKQPPVLLGVTGEGRATLSGLVLLDGGFRHVKLRRMFCGRGLNTGNAASSSTRVLDLSSSVGRSGSKLLGRVTRCKKLFRSLLEAFQVF